jgi:hypothetical protein
MAGRYDNSIPELTLSPLSGSMNSATALYSTKTLHIWNQGAYSVHSIKKATLGSRVADPHSFNPDPAF